MARFVTYDLAIKFYRMAIRIPMSVHLKTQLARAAAGIALNLQEGAGRISFADRRRFYRMAFGSYREARAVLDLVDPKLSEESRDLIAHLGACLYKLISQKG